MSELDLITRTRTYGSRIAVIDDSGEYTYEWIEDASARGAGVLLAGEVDLKEARIAFLVSPGIAYVAAQWSIWRAGGVAVPLSVHHPLPELEYVLDDTGADCIIADAAHIGFIEPAAKARNLRLILMEELQRGERCDLPEVDEPRRAMILYTSGTTSKPKGVVTTHEQIASQIRCLIDAWEWSENDRILHVLPLHHTHGIVNVLLCALWAGAVCRMLPGFDASRVWREFQTSSLTLFMAVPTIYTRLIDDFDKAAPEEQDRRTASCRNFRLMVSGSAALPVSVLERWRGISGHTLLERYGMTEIGMALSNPLDGERRPGSVGRPLPGVELRLVDEQGIPVSGEGSPGEIQVRGPNVFLEYWHRPEATEASFRDGWFCTGDTAVLERGYYRILGRNSVDIIKTGGYKVSALEIEEVLLTNPEIKACAVVGIEDADWGERVCAGIVPANGEDLSLESLRAWAKERLAPYKIPSRIKLMDDLPRNALGKVVKPALKGMF